MDDSDLTDDARRCNAFLLAAFPELTQAYEAEDYKGAYIIYAFLLNPMLSALLEAQDEDSEQLQRVFNFIELALTSDDEYLVNLISIEPLEAVNLQDEILDRALPYMGPVTRAGFEATPPSSPYSWQITTPVEDLVTRATQAALKVFLRHDFQLWGKNWLNGQYEKFAGELDQYPNWVIQGGPGYEKLTFEMKAEAAAEMTTRAAANLLVGKRADARNAAKWAIMILNDTRPNWQPDNL